MVPWKPERNRIRNGMRVPTPAPFVRRVQPYRCVSSLDRIDPHASPEPMKLDWNESTIPPSPLVLERITAFLNNTHHLNWYPDQRARELTQKLEEYTGVDASKLLVTAGSDAALDLLCQTYIGPNDEVVVPSPTYTHFLVYAGARGAHILQVYGRDPFELDVDAIMQSLSARTKMVYLVSPSNPTGLVYPPALIARIARAAPQAVVVVDEAYFEFAESSAIQLVETYPNIVITRTFSKSFGIAGLRIGYLVAPEGIIEDLRRLYNPKSVNVLGQIAATAALEDLEYLYSYVNSVNEAKEHMGTWLSERGFLVRVTAANFIMMKVPNPGAFIALCEEEGVYIRDRSMQPQLDQYVRMNVGTMKQTHELCERLERAIQRLPRLA